MELLERCIAGGEQKTLVSNSGVIRKLLEFHRHSSQTHSLSDWVRTPCSGIGFYPAPGTLIILPLIRCQSLLSESTPQGIFTEAVFKYFVFFCLSVNGRTGYAVCLLWQETPSYFSACSSWDGGRASESAGCGQGEPSREQQPCEPMPVGVPHVQLWEKPSGFHLTLALMLLWAVVHNLGCFMFSWAATCMNVEVLVCLFFFFSTWIALDFQEIIFLGSGSEWPPSMSI